MWLGSILQSLTTLTSKMASHPMPGSMCKALSGYTVGSRQAEHESQGESMEEDDIAKSRVGNTLVQETNR